MRKTIILAALVALFGAGALAQARDVTATEPTNPVEVAKPDAPAVQNKEDGRERRSASRAEYRDHDGSRKHHDEARENDDENEKQGRRH